VARLRALYEKHLADPCRFAPEVAAIVDERSAWYAPVGAPWPGALLTNLRHPLYRLGAPVGWYLLDDLLAGKVPPAKVYVMQDAFVLDAGQRSKLVALLRRQKATAVWFFAPGYLDPERGPVGPEAMEALTGLRLAPLAAPVPDTVSPVAGAPLCAGMTKPFGGGFEGLRPQLAAAARPRVEAIAIYPSGELAAAATDAPGYRSVFISSLGVPPELLRNIARRAGVHVYCDSNDAIEGDGHFLAISATSEGVKTIRLARAARLLDALTGAQIGHGREVRLRLRLGEARLMWVEAQR
jgi:hypothetical protein